MLDIEACWQQWTFPGRSKGLTHCFVCSLDRHIITDLKLPGELTCKMSRLHGTYYEVQPTAKPLMVEDAFGLIVLNKLHKYTVLWGV